MLRIGLTGGIGAGKSAVASRLAGHGALVIDADQLAREVVAPGTSGLREVVEAFGPAVLDAGGRLDRSALAEAVFDNPPARQQLEAIIHPRVRTRTAELTAAAPPGAVVVNDVPLLVEVGLAATYHLVLVVEAAEQARIDRLVRDRPLSRQQAESRIRAQASDAQRRAAADVLLTNDGSLADLHAAVDRLWRDRLRQFAAHLRHSNAAPRPDRPRLVAYDPDWPAQYRRLAARISHATGGPPPEHIGSTAVPDLPAKDVIDLQLVVPDLATADGLADRLAQAGFPRLPGEWRDHPKGRDTPAGDATAGDATAGWPKRVHGNADPGRPVNLHLRPADSPGVRVSRLLRDWLRADPTARAEYAALKQRLADQAQTLGEYTAAKEPWFDQAWPRAQHWAEGQGWREAGSPRQP